MNRLLRVGSALLPFLIIGGLLYAALFIRPVVAASAVAAPAIAARDAFYGVAVPRPGVVWAVGRDGKIVRSDDAGAHWTVQASGTRQNLQSIVALDDRRAVVVGNAATVLRTEDGGAHWQAVPLALAEGAMPKLLRLRAGPGSTLAAVGEAGTVLLSSDAGRSWRAIGKHEDVAWNDIVLVPGAWLLVGEFGRLQRSSDDGATWTAVDSPVKASLNAIAWRGDAQGGSGVAVGVEGSVLIGSAGGTQWTALPPQTSAHLLDVMAHGKGWVATTAQGQLLYGDGGLGPWRARHIAERDYGWRAAIAADGDRLVLAGAGLGALAADGHYTGWK